MTNEEIYESPDKDIVRRPIILSQVQSVLVFGLVALLALIFARPTRLFWAGFLLAVIYWTDRKFFVWRLFELNERLKRIEHKINGFVPRNREPS